MFTDVDDPKNHVKNRLRQVERWHGKFMGISIMYHVVVFLKSIYDGILAIIHEGSSRTAGALLPGLSRAATNYGTTCKPACNMYT